MLHYLKRWNKYINGENINKLFESIIKTSHDGLYVCDHEGNTMLVNDALIKVTNISKKDFFSNTLGELIHKGILPKSCAYMTLQTKQKENMIIHYYHGKKAVLTSTPVFDKKGEIFCIVSNVRDITELKNLHEQLEESNRLKSEYEEILFSKNQFYTNQSSSFIYKSKEVGEIISLSNRLAKTDSPILILGESGSGKDVLAHHIHKKSNRKGNFIKVNCAAIPADLIEAELFGHEQGAFTGAQGKREGLFEQSNGGTIFLDEIGELPIELQAKLLTVIEDKKVRRIGSTQAFSIDLRIIAATNADLTKMIENKEFRHDLYYRLNVLPITIPPLRNRKEDIPILTLFFLNNLNKKYANKKQLDPRIIDYFLTYRWPGNVRELKNIIERMYHMSDSKKITVDQIPQAIKTQDITSIATNNFTTQYSQPTNINTMHPSYEKTLPLNKVVEKIEKQYISEVIQQHETLKEAAKSLGISLSTLTRKRRQYNL